LKNFSPTRKDKKFIHHSTSIDHPSDVVLADGLYFKSNNQINPEMEDHLLLLHKEGIEQQAQITEDNVEKKQTKTIKDNARKKQTKDAENNTEKKRTSKIVKFDENKQLNPDVEDRLALSSKEEVEKQVKDVENKPTTEIFKFDENKQLNPEKEDRLALSYKEELEKQVKDVENQAEKKQISEIFEFDDNTQLNENIPGISMSFLDRLIHQLTRPRASKIDDFNDEEFSEINQNEITAVSNDNIDQFLDNKNKLENGTTLKDSIATFIEELTEETEVIRGSIDYETLHNRRSRRAKSVFSGVQNNKVLDNRTSL